MTTSERIAAFVAEPAVAVVGVSRSGKGFGNLACRELRAKGYRVYPVHPHVDAIGDVHCYRRLADVPEPVHAVLAVVPPEVSIDVVRDAAAVGAKYVWLQQGAESPQVIALCHDLGLETIAGECILMYMKPTGLHRVHRWVHDVFHGAVASREESVARRL